MKVLKGQTRGLQPLDPWGPDPYPLFAAMPCHPNSHYELCADTCSLGCSALSAPPQCPETCAEGCQCDSGFLNDGKGCVPIQECGCYHNGVYYEVGTGSSLDSPSPHLPPTPLPLPMAPPWPNLSSPSWLLPTP